MTIYIGEGGGGGALLRSLSYTTKICQRQKSILFIVGTTGTIHSNLCKSISCKEFLHHFCYPF